MSSEVAKRQKVDAPQQPSASAAASDHRKRRRNRTTQSCLNCHTSKRMVHPPTSSFRRILSPLLQCDRKRPCGRCTQLGIVCCSPCVRALRNQGTHSRHRQVSACTKLTTPVKGSVPPVLIVGPAYLLIPIHPLRTEAADDKTRLQKRVAELEGVIREASLPHGVRRVNSLTDGAAFIAQE